MTTQQKLIKFKLNLLELGSYPGDVGDACRFPSGAQRCIDPRSQLEVGNWDEAHGPIGFHVNSWTHLTVTKTGPSTANCRAARREYRCWRPPTSGNSTILPSSGGWTSLGSGASLPSERYVREARDILRVRSRISAAAAGRPPLCRLFQVQ